MLILNRTEVGTLISFNRKLRVKIKTLSSLPCRKPGVIMSRQRLVCPVLV